MYKIHKKLAISKKKKDMSCVSLFSSTADYLLILAYSKDLCYSRSREKKNVAWGTNYL